MLKTNFDGYVKGNHFNERMHDILGPGIFNTDGELWRIQRKTAANIFSVKHFKSFVSEVFTAEMDKLTIQLQNFAQQGNIIDLQELMFKFTLDGFCKIGFHVNLDSISSKEPVPFATAFDSAQQILMYRFLSPLWKYEEWVLPVGERMRQNRKVSKPIGF